MENDTPIKVYLTGPENSGKSELLNQLNAHYQNLPSERLIVKSDQNPSWRYSIIKLKAFTFMEFTAGSYYLDIDFNVIVIDLGTKDAFDEIKDSQKAVERFTHRHYDTILLGNRRKYQPKTSFFSSLLSFSVKEDDFKGISTEEAEKYALDHGWFYFETEIEKDPNIVGFIAKLDEANAKRLIQKSNEAI